jgi:hypothetical protein
MTDTTTVDDETAPVDDTVVAGDAVTEDDGGAGAHEPLELAGGIAPEGPIKDRLLLPFLLPWLCIVAVALYALNISRIFLAGDSTAALVIGTLITVLILAGATIISASPRLRTSTLAMIMGFVLVIVVSGGLLSLGPSLSHDEGEAAAGYVEPEGPPTATLETVAGPGTTFSGVPFDTVYTTTAGIVEINFTGQTGHTLLFTDPELNGFELETPTNEKGKVELAPGSYTIYCDVTGHRAQGMQATIDVT